MKIINIKDTNFMIFNGNSFHIKLSKLIFNSVRYFKNVKFSIQTFAYNLTTLNLTTHQSAISYN